MVGYATYVVNCMVTWLKKAQAGWVALCPESTDDVRKILEHSESSENTENSERNRGNWALSIC